MNYIENLLREYPVIALFLTVGLGFFVGKLKFKAFTLGSVTATLLVGILIGQIGIKLSDQIKTLFFMLFLFSVGYSVGPGFFRSLKGTGLKQVLFAVCMSFCCFGVTLLISWLMAYNAGETVGLFSGSQTCSSLLGVGSEAIKNGTAPESVKQSWLDIIPVCYAVTYVYGTLGTVIILGTFGPKLLGGLEKVKEKTAELQAQFSYTPWRDDPAYISAMSEVSHRVYKVANGKEADGKTVREFERRLHHDGLRVFVDKIHRAADGKVLEGKSDLRLHAGDRVAVVGRTEFLTGLTQLIGPEIADAELLDYPVKQAPVMLRNRKYAGHTLHNLLKEKWMRGVVLKEISRDGAPVEYDDETQLKSGDMLTLVGKRKRLNGAADRLGHLDRPSTQTDIMFVMLAVFVGGVIGTATVVIDEIPLSFGTSGGALIAGLVFGWLRTKRPTYGHIPKSVLWFMNQLGLNVFIGVVGINCAPTFISGIRQVGWALPVVGAIGTTIPLLIGIFLGARVFKMNPAFTLGCCAGTRTCTAALGAVQDTIGSTLPTIGYAVTYAVSNVLLMVWGLLAVLLR